MTAPHSVCSTKETYVLLVVVFAIDGISHLMAQNVQDRRQLKGLFTFHQLKPTLIVPAILKDTVNRFLKAMYGWDSG